MSLKYVLTQVQSLSGYRDAQNDQLIEIINRAARMMYMSSDLPDSLKESVLVVSEDKRIALPNYVDSLRGAREYYLSPVDRHVEIVGIVRSYKSETWNNLWNSFRVIGTSPINTTITNASNLVIETATLETTPVTLTIVGRTLNSSKKVETITLDALSVQSDNQYIEIYSLVKSATTEDDIYVLDIDGNELACIPSYLTESCYTMVDVSKYQFKSGNSDASNIYMQCLFKHRYMNMSKYYDEFQCRGFDDALIFRTMEEIEAAKPNGTEKANYWNIRFLDALRARVFSQDKEIKSEILYAEPAYNNLVPGSYTGTFNKSYY